MWLPDHGIRVPAAAVILFAVAGCSTNAGAPPSTKAESGGTSCPSDVATGCSCPTSDNGQPCVCDCFSMPECPADLQGGGPTWPVACDHADSCLNCAGSGVLCTCLDAGVVGADGGGSHWQCIGTEQACTGGTFHG